MADMKPRTISTPSMIVRQSTAAPITHFAYDEISVDFNENPYTYEYKTYRGEIQARTIPSVQMRGR